MSACGSESPYAEVRAAVSNTDDPNMPVNTIRMWFLGVILTLVVSGVNMFFSMRCAYSPPFFEVFWSNSFTYQ